MGQRVGGGKHIKDHDALIQEPVGERDRPLANDMDRKEPRLLLGEGGVERVGLADERKVDNPAPSGGPGRRWGPSDRWLGAPRSDSIP